MKINAISNAQNFGKIKIAENQANKLALSIIRNLPLKDSDSFQYKIDRVSEFKNTHVVVNENGEVYIKNKNRIIPVMGNVSLYTKYHMALAHALRIGD